MLHLRVPKRIYNTGSLPQPAGIAAPIKNGDPRRFHGKPWSAAARPSLNIPPSRRRPLLALMNWDLLSVQGLEIPIAPRQQCQLQIRPFSQRPISRREVRTERGLGGAVLQRAKAVGPRQERRWPMTEGVKPAQSDGSGAGRRGEHGRYGCPGRPPPLPAAPGPQAVRLRPQPRAPDR